MRSDRRTRVRRWLVGVPATLILLCLAAAAVSALINRGRPTASPVVERLTELDEARLVEAERVRRQLGGRVWPNWEAAEIPIILYNETYAFLVGVLDPPDGWIRVPSGEKRGGPWEPVPGDTVGGGPYFRGRLAGSGETPEAFTVRVGDRWVASMTTKDWTQIKLVGTMGEGMPAPLAAVFPYGLVVNTFNSDWHITAVLHESFHAYQGTVAPDRLGAAERATALAARYPWDDQGFQAAWEEEVDLLAQAVESESAGEVERLAVEFLAHREARRADHGLGSDAVAYERQREWLEGLAKYVELGIWQEAFLAEDYEPNPALAADEDFEGYGTFEARWRAEVAQLRRQGADLGDVTYYYAGWAQGVLLDRLMPGWKSEAMKEGVFLEDLLREAVGRP